MDGYTKNFSATNGLKDIYKEITKVTKLYLWGAGKMKKLAILFLILSFGYAPVFASEHIITHIWESDSQTRAGKVVSCWLQLNAVNQDQILMTMNLSVMAEEVDVNHVKNITMLKVTASRVTRKLQSVPIKIDHGWVKSSSGMSIGNLKQIDVKPEPYFLGSAPGLDLFDEIIMGAVENGITVGYQERPGTYNKVYKISEPPPLDIVTKLLSCFRTMQNGFLASK